ncbi:unnamed protein product [Sympodiomycopsis kandeliae]
MYVRGLGQAHKKRLELGSDRQVLSLYSMENSASKESKQHNEHSTDERWKAMDSYSAPNGSMHSSFGSSNYLFSPWSRITGPGQNRHRLDDSDKDLI